MKKWLDDVAEASLLSPAELQAKLEQMRQLVEAPGFTYETYHQVSDQAGDIRLLVCAMIARGTTSQEQAARIALAQLSKLYPKAVNKVKRIYAKQVLAERRAQKAGQAGTKASGEAHDNRVDEGEQDELLPANASGEWEANNQIGWF